ncbi:MAG: hypothetical protein ACTSR1_14790 [Candidatus Heimdallarchaeota archaeon]
MLEKYFRNNEYFRLGWDTICQILFKRKDTFQKKSDFEEESYGENTVQILSLTDCVLSKVWIN